MKTIAVDRAIRDNSSLAGSVDSATNLLEDVLGESAGLVEVEWRLNQDERGRSLVVLRLSDWTGSAEGRFAPEELSRPEHLRGRFIRLWGDLLQIRSHQQLESLGSGGASDRTLDSQDAWTEIVDAVSSFRECEGFDPLKLKLPVRYADALMKLGPSFWGDFFQEIRRSGIRSFDGQTLLGMRVELTTDAGAELELE